MLFADTKVISTVYNNGFFKNEFIAFHSLQGIDANRAERTKVRLYPTPELMGASCCTSALHLYFVRAGRRYRLESQGVKAGCIR